MALLIALEVFDEVWEEEATVSGGFDSCHEQVHANAEVSQNSESISKVSSGSCTSEYVRKGCKESDQHFSTTLVIFCRYRGGRRGCRDGMRFGSVLCSSGSDERRLVAME